MLDRGRAGLTRRSWSWGFDLDLRIGFRRLWRSRGYTTTAILTFAVCLGANAAVFTIVDQALLNPLRVPDPSRIVLMANQLPHAGMGVVGQTSAPRNYFDRVAGVDVFTHQAMLIRVDRAIGSEQGVAQIHGMAATPSLFPLLRVEPVLGRSFTEAEGEVENRQRIILSHGLWKELFDGDPGAVGTELRVADLPFTVVGIMPEGFSFIDPAVRFWIPLAFTPGERQNPIAMNYLNVLQVSDNTRWLTVIGVVPELLLEDLAGRQSAAGTFYTVFGENSPGAFPRRYGFAIRSGANPEAIMGRVRLELARIDPELPLFDVQTMEQRKALSLAPRRLAMSLAGAFGAVALFLSALGVYGILSYLVVQRTRELGIRIALGSTAAGVFALVLREAVILVAGGLVIGMAGALALGPLLESQIFGIQPHNPLLIGMMAFVLAAAAIPACVFPSRRAARVDPVVVLNEE